MNNVKITQEQVNSVANALLAEGLTPTVLDVRKRLEGGSMAVIWSYFQLWQAKQGSETAKKEETAQSFTLPVDVIQTIEKQVNAQLDAYKATSEKELSALREANEEIAKECQKAHELLETAQSERKNAEQKASEASEQMEQIQAELARKQSEIDVEKDSATQSRMDLVKAQLKLESLSRLEADLDQLYKTLEQERVAKLNAEHAEKAMESRLETEKAARLKAEKELLDLLKRKDGDSSPLSATAK